MPQLINGKVTYQGGEALPAVGSEAYKQARQGITPDSTISVGDMGKDVIPLTTPPPTQPSFGGMDTVLAGYTANQNKQSAQLEADRQQLNKDRGQVALAYQQLAGLGNDAENIYQKAGVDTKRQLVDQYTSQIEAEQRALTNKVRALEKNPEGLFGGALQDEINRVSRDSLAKQADLAILQNAANRDYSTAAAIADRKVQLLTEQYKVQLDGLKFFYQENKDEFNKEDQRFYEGIIKQEERAYQEKISDMESVNSLALTAKQNGAPDSIVSAVLGAKDYREAILRVGDYLNVLGGIGGEGGIGDIPEASPYQTERATRTIQSVDELLNQVNGKTVGWGSLLAGIPGTDAKYFRSQVDTLVANITFGELTAMREASKTGGALGQVSDREGRLLGAALGALADRRITPEQYRTQLRRVKSSIQRWQEAVNGGVPIESTITAPDGTQVIIID